MIPIILGFFERRVAVNDRPVRRDPSIGTEICFALLCFGLFIYINIYLCVLVYFSSTVLYVYCIVYMRKNGYIIRSFVRL